MLHNTVALLYSDCFFQCQNLLEESVCPWSINLNKKGPALQAAASFLQLYLGVSHSLKWQSFTIDVYGHNEEV